MEQAPWNNGGLQHSVIFFAGTGQRNHPRPLKVYQKVVVVHNNGLTVLVDELNKTRSTAYSRAPGLVGAELFLEKAGQDIKSFFTIFSEMHTPSPLYLWSLISCWLDEVRLACCEMDPSLNTYLTGANQEQKASNSRNT